MSFALFNIFVRNIMQIRIYIFPFPFLFLLKFFLLFLLFLPSFEPASPEQERLLESLHFYIQFRLTLSGVTQITQKAQLSNHHCVFPLMTGFSSRGSRLCWEKQIEKASK